MKLRLPISTHNWLSLIGVVIALISLFMIFFLFVIATFFGSGSSYLGLIIYMVLPAFLILGLILIPIGMLFKRRQLKKSSAIPEEEWPKIDLNDIRHRNAFMIFAVGTTILLFISAIGSYEAYHYSESVQFCGTTCHNVMTPEYTAYQNSPHARVTCADCHVGEGADWYVKSKLSGMYQIYAVTLGTVPRPIPTPIHNLRPARETCEKCHWPEKFYARSLRFEKHYLSDEENTEWNIGMTIKTGGMHSANGLNEGIHWHINENVKIEYAASDEKRQTIPWVKYTDLLTGDVKIFNDTNEPVEEDSLAKLDKRKMDCMDCHNRPSHNYKPPTFFIDNAITAGEIPKLPGIKMEAMNILGNEFESTDSAMVFIKDQVETYYSDNYPEIFESRRAEVDKAVTGIQDEFKKYIFPEMKVRWDVYPNNIGHMEFKGCFRCHDGAHETSEGEVISRDCNLCHSINMQGPENNLQFANIESGLEFKHPVDIDEAWKESMCVDCHTGLNP